MNTESTRTSFTPTTPFARKRHVTGVIGRRRSVLDEPSATNRTTHSSCWRIIGSASQSTRTNFRSGFDALR